MAKDIKFNVLLTVDGKEQLVTATTSVKELRDNLNAAKSGAQKFRDALIGFNEKMEAIERMSDAFADLSEKMKDYARSAAEAAAMTGMQGDELSEFRNRAQAVANAFGEDITEVMRGAANVSKAFGISARDALQLVQDGFVAGANANGEFLDTLREYPRYFKEAGISAEGFVAITANAARQGVFSDKGVDSIKEANLRLREMTTATAAALDGIGISSEEVMRQLADGSTTTFAVMQQVAAKLQELPASSSAVGTAIADIFGSPGEDAGLEYIKTLADVQLSMEGAKQSADDYSKSLEGQVDAQSSLMNSITGLIDLTQVFSSLAPVLNVASQVGMSIVAIASMTEVVKKLALGQTLLAACTRASSVANGVWAATGVITSNIMVALGVSATGASVGVTMLKVAIRGLLIATGVGAVIAALTMGIEMLMNALDGSNQAEEESAQASQKAMQARSQEESQLASTRAALTLNIAKLKSFNGTKEQERKLVQQMNNTYGETMGYYSTAAQWYEVLTKNSEKYCRQLILEEMIKRKAKEMADREIEADQIDKNLANNHYSHEGEARQLHGMVRSNPNDPTSPMVPGTYTVPAYKKSDYQKAIEKRDSYRAKNEAEAADIAKWAREQASITFDKGEGYSATPPSPTTSTPGRTNKPGRTDHPDKNDNKQALKGSIDWYEDELQRLSREIQATSDEAAAAALQADYEKKAEQLKELKVRIGIDKPEEKETLNYMDELRRQLQDAQKNADAATTVEARVKANADVQRIQGEIDTATRGKLTIEAEAEPAYILQGSTADKRQSYQNAENKVNRIKQDYEIGIIGESEAQAAIDKINEELKKLGVEPIKVNIKEDGVKQVSDDLRGATDAVNQLGGSLSSLGNAVGVPELNIAGTLAQAIATMTLSYAQALSQSSLLGPWAWVAFGATGLAQLAAMITAVKSMSAYATGGIVGGNSTTGDRILARVNSGEMILNKGQQSRLFAMINGGFTPAVSLPAPREAQPVSIDLTALGAMIDRSPVWIEGKFRTEGRDLVCAVSNYKKISALSGKRTI